MNRNDQTFSSLSSEECLQRILDTDAVGVLFFDSSGVVIYANDTFLRISGYTRQHVTSRSLHWRDLTPPEYLAESEAQMQKFLETGRLGPYEKEYFAADGSRRWMSFSGVDLGNDTMAKFCFDLTKHKQTEDTLRESEEFFRAIVSQTAAGICRTDLNGAVSFVNRKLLEMLGYDDESEVVGRSIWELTYGDALAENKDRLERLAQTGETFEMEKRLMRKDGSPLWAIVSISAMRDASGKPQSAIAVILDATLRQRTEVALRGSEERLRGLNEDLGERVRERTAELQAEVNERRAGEERIKNLLRQLVSTEEQQRRRIARELHDTLGQQLAALHLSIEVLKTRADGDVTTRKTIERMREVFDQLNSNVEFLAWELRPPTLDLLGLDAAIDSYVREWSEQFNVEALYQGIGVKGLRLSPEVEINMYRILQEALQNVHKHAGAGRVHVLLERRDHQALLIVEDDGKGYDVEGIGDGHDMGLLNMRERAALFGGAVEIETQSGEGTTVFVRVPIN